MPMAFVVRASGVSPWSENSVARGSAQSNEGEAHNHIHASPCCGRWGVKPGSGTSVERSTPGVKVLARRPRSIVRVVFSPCGPDSAELTGPLFCLCDLTLYR